MSIVANVAINMNSVSPCVLGVKGIAIGGFRGAMLLT